MLASEALREDLAPLEPGEVACRWTLGGIAISLALLGVSLHGARGMLGSASGLTFAAAAATVVLAGLPLSYAIRAAGIAALGLALMLLGVEGQGPLSGLALGSSISIEISRLVALTALPSALLFRARYRAYPVARWVLGAALAASVPFVIGRTSQSFSPDAALAHQATAALNVAVILAGLFGFMGANTTGGGSVWAALVVGVLCSDVTVRGLNLQTAHWLALGAAAIGTACAATLTAMGTYHLLAAWLATDARREAKESV